MSDYKSFSVLSYSYLTIFIGYVITQINWLVVENKTLEKIGWLILALGLIVNIGYRIYQKSQGDELETDSAMENIFILSSFPIMLLCIIIIIIAVILKLSLS